MTTHSEPSVNVILLLSSSHSRIWSLIVGGMMGVWKRTRKSKNMKTTGSVQTYPFLFENGYIRFLPVWRTVHRYPMKTVTENTSFQKLSPERRSLKTRFCSTCVDTEVFENDYITVLDISMRKLPSKMVLMVQSLLLWVLRYFPCGQAKTIKKTARGRPFLTCFFFKNGEEKSPF